MAEKKEATLPKGLTVRTNGQPSRNRAGYSFNQDYVYIDVEQDGLTQEDIDALRGDKQLTVVPVGGNSEKLSVATRRDANGNAVTTTAGAMMRGAATQETATAEMVEAAKKGEEVPLHPSFGGGAPVSDTLHPDAVAETVKRLGIEPTALNASTGKGDKKEK